MIFIDSHCHLDLLLEKNDLNEVIDRARKNGVKYIQTICTKLKEFPKILQIVEENKGIFASVGVHPNEIEKIVNHDTLVELASHPKVIGIGETWLDYYYKTVTKKNQIDSFIQHIITSQQIKLPVIIHTRDAEIDTADILTAEMKNATFPALIHCFTSTTEFARQMLNIGLYISIAGIVTFKNAAELKEVVKFVPLDRLLIETDSPYLAPVPMRGKQNEPAFVKYVAEYIAELKSISVEQVASQTTANFFTLFSKADL